MDKIAIVRIRGIRKIKPKIKRTMELLRLEKPNHCVVMDLTPQTKGMLHIVHDYVTYGKVSEKTLYELLVKKGEKDGKRLSKNIKDAEIKKMAKEIIGGKKTKEFIDPVFRLHPPKKGHKNIKAHYPSGDLGKREELDTLLKKMM